MSRTGLFVWREESIRKPAAFIAGAGTIERGNRHGAAVVALGVLTPATLSCNRCCFACKVSLQFLLSVDGQVRAIRSRQSRQPGNCLPAEGVKKMQQAVGLPPFGHVQKQKRFR